MQIVPWTLTVSQCPYKCNLQRHCCNVNGDTNSLSAGINGSICDKYNVTFNRANVNNYAGILFAFHRLKDGRYKLLNRLTCLTQVLQVSSKIEPVSSVIYIDVIY